MTFLSLFWPALVASALVGAAAPAVGTFVVQRRLSLIGEGVGHFAFAGVAIGLWLEISPLAAALVFGVGGALAIDHLRRRSPDEADIVLALFFYASIATAVVVASLSGTFNVNLFGFLFGQVLTVTSAELVTIGALAVAAVLVVAVLYRGLLAIAIDEEAASVAGVPVGGVNFVLMVLAALTIGVGMQVVGLLLVAALMVLPVGTARNLVRSFRATLIVSSAVGAIASLAGLLAARAMDAAPGGTIVLVAAAVFVASELARAARARPRRRGAAHA